LGVPLAPMLKHPEHMRTSHISFRFSNFAIFIAVRKLRMPVPGSSWFLDAAALGGWTARGTARVLQDRLLTLPQNQRPRWLEGLSEYNVEELLTQVIADAADNAAVIEEYMLAEREKGRDFDEVYDSVQPFIAQISRPLSEEVKDGSYHRPALPEALASFSAASTSKIGRSFEAQLRESNLQSAPHRLLAPRIASQAEPGLSRGRLTACAADSLKAEDLSEPLMLVGSPNGWDANLAFESFRFETCMDTSPDENVKMLRVQVPEEGVQFQILSQRRVWEFILFPGKKSRLHRGEDRQLAAKLALGVDAGEKAKSRDFTIKGDPSTKHKPRDVAIKISLTLEKGAVLWLEEAS